MNTPRKRVIKTYRVKNISVFKEDTLLIELTKKRFFFFGLDKMYPLLKLQRSKESSLLLFPLRDGKIEKVSLSDTETIRKRITLQVVRVPSHYNTRRLELRITRQEKAPAPLYLSPNSTNGEPLTYEEVCELIFDSLL